MPSEYDVSVIVVSWNVRELLRQCISSIFEQTKNIRFEVIVIDNASHDGSAEMVKKIFPQVRLISNKTNDGFAKANNQGLEIARGEYTLLLNPDTIIVDRAIEKTYAWMNDNHQAAIVGCRIKNPDGTNQESVRSFPSLAAMALILLKLHRIFPWAKPLKKYLLPNFDFSKSQKVDQVMGAFFMIAPETRKRLGNLDERYFIWFEEVDYCRMAKKAGLETWYYADAEIIHFYGQSFRQVMSLRKQARLNNSLLKYYKKHGTALERLSVLLLYPWSLVPSLVVSLCIQPFHR